MEGRNTKVQTIPIWSIRVCIQKFPDWPPGARTANGTAPCHKVQLCRYFVSQSSEFCRHNPFCCFSTSVYCCKHIFRYRLSPETFGYTLVYVCSLWLRIYAHIFATIIMHMLTEIRIISVKLTSRLSQITQ